MIALNEMAQIVAFGLCGFIAVAGALGMATTMSMFRSGVFLMASFIGVAGLFVLLAADLMALLQIMMYIGGMLVMILFMVLFMSDPGGAMMAAMPDMMSPVERFFSRGLQQAKASEQEQEQEARQNGDKKAGGESPAQNGKQQHGPHQDHAQQSETGAGQQEGGGMQMDAASMEQEGSMQMGDMSQAKEGGMQMDDMSMVTPVRRLAAWLAAVIGVGLVALILLRPSWPVSDAQPEPQSARAVGMLLMGKYMVAFEGAGFLILIGIFGAVLLARVERHPDDDSRSARVARTDPAPTIEPDHLKPSHPMQPERPAQAEQPQPQPDHDQQLQHHEHEHEHGHGPGPGPAHEPGHGHPQGQGSRA